IRVRGKETAMSTHVKGLVRGRYLGRRSPMRRTRQQSTDNDPPRRSARGTALVGWGLVGLLALGSLGLGGFVERTAAAQDRFKFEMVPSGCLPTAHGDVTITPLGTVERMDVRVSGLPPNTDFDLFVIQVPHGPFGMSWYQGDIETDDEGEGHGRFIGRFSIETFIVAPGSQPAPVVHESPIRDADSNPQTAPVHTFHLGLWFNSPADGAQAGCPGGPTPFNGDHTAGVQVLNTANFPDLAGPLICVNS